MKKLVVIRGGGELATGIAHRLYNTGYKVLMLERQFPSAIRRNIVFSEAIYDGQVPGQAEAECAGGCHLCQAKYGNP